MFGSRRTILISSYGRDLDTVYEGYDALELNGSLVPPRSKSTHSNMEEGQVTRLVLRFKTRGRLNGSDAPAEMKMRGRQESILSGSGMGSNLPERDKWANKMEFLLAVIGFAVDLGNVWRFPYICYRNGGGAFLIPYLIMFLFGGLPLFYMELALGQFHKAGCISIWNNIAPVFKGIGFAICFICTYIAIFYNTIIAWAVYFLIRSFAAEVPWKRCGNPWNTELCVETGDNATEHVWNVTRHNQSLYVNQTLSKLARSPAEEFFLLASLRSFSDSYGGFEVLEIDKSDGFENMGSIKWSLALCLFGVFVVVYFALWKGPSSSGKAVWITATLPYCVLIVLLIRGITLPGAWIGIRYYLTPQWAKLTEAGVWIDAATQIFFSLGPGFGVLLALSSYNDFNNNCYKDALVTSVVNCMTSFISGFVIFSTLGYMSLILNKDVSEVAGEGGPGLIFVVYPQAIATMSGSSFWSVIFFFMLITLGVDSTFGGLEAFITGVVDEYPRWVGRRRELFVLGLVIYCYLGSLPTTTYGGNYLVEFLDQYGVSFSILFIVLVETIAVCWCYGVKRFCDDVETMLGFRPGIFWQFCWKFVCPIFITVIFFVACAQLKPLTFEDYVYPGWSVAVGWVIRLSSILCIPFYAIYSVLFVAKGSLKQRLLRVMKPDNEYEPAGGGAHPNHHHHPGSGADGGGGGSGGGANRMRSPDEADSLTHRTHSPPSLINSPQPFAHL